jgi:predicted transcriptional regulator
VELKGGNEMNLNYEAVCKIVGNLYINGVIAADNHEAQIRELTLINQKLQNSLKELSAPKENVDELPASGTVN